MIDGSISAIEASYISTRSVTRHILYRSSNGSVESQDLFTRWVYIKRK